MISSGRVSLDGSFLNAYKLRGGFWKRTCSINNMESALNSPNALSP